MLWWKRKLLPPFLFTLHKRFPFCCFLFPMKPQTEWTNERTNETERLISIRQRNKTSSMQICVFNCREESTTCAQRAACEYTTELHLIMANDVLLKIKRIIIGVFRIIIGKRSWDFFRQFSHLFAHRFELKCNTTLFTHTLMAPQCASIHTINECVCVIVCFECNANLRSRYCTRNLNSFDESSVTNYTQNSWNTCTNIWRLTIADSNVCVGWTHSLYFISFHFFLLLLIFIAMCIFAALYNLSLDLIHSR